MDELGQNRQYYPVIILPILPVTSASKNFSLISREFTRFFFVPDAFASTMINDEIG